MTTTAQTTPTVRVRVLRGLGWKVASLIVVQLSRVVVAVVLARILAPHQFGLAAMAVVFSSLGLVFSDLALGAALIQRRSLSETDRSTVFWTTVGAGTLFMVVGIGLSWPIADFYGEPDVQPLLVAVAVGFLITSLGATQSALLARAMDFRSLELRLMAGIVAGSVVGIVLALAGFGAWAVILQQLTASAVSATLLWTFSSWRPKLLFSRASLRDLGAFSGNVFGTRMLFYLSRNGDNLLVGRFLGPSALGAYAISYSIMLVPFERIAGPIQDVLYPAFSELQDDVRRLGSVWLRVTRVVAAITMPTMLGLMVVADDFVSVVLGSRWEAAVPVIRILASVGLIQSLVRLNSTILQSRDRTGLLLRWSLLITVVNVLAFVVGLHWGIVGVAAAYAIANSALQPVNISLTGKTIGVSLGTFVRNLGGVAQATLLMVLGVGATRLLLSEVGISPALRLGASIAVGVAIYFPALAWRAGDVVSELARLRRHSNRPAPDPA